MLEALRADYRPARVRVLFAGESPPAGGTFFYAADSHLCRYTQEAFARAYGREWESGHAFLQFFRELGCYLDDLCLDPVNNLDAAARLQARAIAVPSFAERLRQYSPQVVVSVMSGTLPNIDAALRQAGMADVTAYVMPYPTFGNQHRYVNRLVATLDSLRRQGVLE